MNPDDDGGFVEPAMAPGAGTAGALPKSGAAGAVPAGFEPPNPPNAGGAAAGVVLPAAAPPKPVNAGGLDAGVVEPAAPAPAAAPPNIDVVGAAAGVVVEG